MTENTSTPARILSDWEINQYATFYPHREAADENGTTSHPCIEIGGDANGDGAMQAYVYARTASSSSRCTTTPPARTRTGTARGPTTARTGT